MGPQELIWARNSPREDKSALNPASQTSPNQESVSQSEPFSLKHSAPNMGSWVLCDHITRHAL